MASTSADDMLVYDVLLSLLFDEASGMVAGAGDTQHTYECMNGWRLATRQRGGGIDCMECERVAWHATASEVLE